MTTKNNTTAFSKVFGDRKFWSENALTTLITLFLFFPVVAFLLGAVGKIYSTFFLWGWDLLVKLLP